MKNYRPGDGTRARKALDEITRAGKMTPVELSNILGTAPKNIGAILYACIGHKLVTKVGRGAGTYYRLTTDQDNIQDIELDLTVEAAAPVNDGDLHISVWSDGDVMIEGATVHTDDGNKVILSRHQAQQLVRMLARPVVAL